MRRQKPEGTQTTRQHLPGRLQHQMVQVQARVKVKPGMVGRPSMVLVQETETQSQARPRCAAAALTSRHRRCKSFDSNSELPPDSSNNMLIDLRAACAVY